VNDYWLAKLICSVNEVDCRKRLQKSIYLLQLADCPLKCEYILHYYGPYSFELAGLIDQLDNAGIIHEEPLGTRYKVSITDTGRNVLSDFEKSQIGKTYSQKIKSFVTLFQELSKENVRVLELAATIAYFHNGDWDKAKKQTAAFKNVRPDDGKLLKAEDLAKKFKKCD
jgi:uncharacterized protein YwgA